MFLASKACCVKLGDSQDAVILRSRGSERSKANQEEVKTREGDHVDSELAEIAVELSGETKRAGGSSDGVGNEVVKISVAGIGELESAEANVVESLVVESEALIGVLDKLVDGKSGIVGLDDRVGHLGRRNDTVGAHDTIRVLLADLGNKQSSHTGSSSSSHRVRNLEALKHVASFALLANDIHDRVDEFGSFGVMALGPVVSSSTLSKDKVIGAKETSVRSRANGVHGSRFEIRKNSTRHIASSLSLVEVHINALQLKRIVSLVASVAGNAMLLGHDLNTSTKREKSQSASRSKSVIMMAISVAYKSLFLYIISIISLVTIHQTM